MNIVMLEEDSLSLQFSQFLQMPWDWSKDLVHESGRSSHTMCFKSPKIELVSWWSSNFVFNHRCEMALELMLFSEMLLVSLHFMSLFRCIFSEEKGIHLERAIWNVHTRRKHTLFEMFMFFDDVINIDDEWMQSVPPLTEFQSWKLPQCASFSWIQFLPTYSCGKFAYKTFWQLDIACTQKYCLRTTGLCSINRTSSSSYVTHHLPSDVHLTSLNSIVYNLRRRRFYFPQMFDNW